MTDDELKALCADLPGPWTWGEAAELLAAAIPRLLAEKEVLLSVIGVTRSWLDKKADALGPESGLGFDLKNAALDLGSVLEGAGPQPARAALEQGGASAPTGEG